MTGNVIEDVDRARIQDAIRLAESNTSGEIYVVISRQAGDFRYVPVLWAAVIAILVPWPLHLLTSWSTTTILVIQAVIFVIFATVASHPAMRRWILPPNLAAEATRKEATSQFLAHGIHLTTARTGVLIYVALADRRVEIIADAGINEKVDQSAWDALAGEIVSAARDGHLPDGIVNAVRAAGELLAHSFPPQPQDQNELPDRVVEI